MSKKKIDIAMSFNDLTPPQEICFVPKSISYYDQLVNLVKSIKINWDTSIYDYQIYVHHSRPLDESKRNYLELHDCKVIYNEYETQQYFNRFNIYNYETDGDYTLILDTDMLVLKTPTLNFDKEIYVKETPANPINLDTWKYLYKKCGLTFIPEDSYHYNGGCVLIKNSCKQKLFDIMHTPLYKEVLTLLEGGPGRSRHYSPQILLSLLVKNLDWGHLNSDVNVFSTKPYTLSEVSILHYLGVHGYTSQVQKLIQEVQSHKII